MDLFEVISEDEFIAEQGVPSDDSHTSPFTDGSGGTSPLEASEGTKVYCKFCKGYYYAEYHHGRQEGGES